GTPFRASVPTDAIYAEGTGQMLETRAQDLLTPASTYAVSGSLSPAASSAPINLNADLQLPPEPLKLHRLARHIVSGQRGPMAQLLAIRGYLRDSGQFHYDIHAVPPPDQDAVVSFLFSSRSGFCNQFASSLVVLAREVGIPARLVSGFVSGTYANGSFLVRDRDAHSWAQAYVPGTGWVMLDPTPGFQPDPAQSPVSGRNNPLHAAARPAVAPVPRPTTGSGWGRASSFHQVPTPRIHHARPSGPPSGMILGFMVFALIVAGLFVYAAWPRSLRQLYLSAVRGSPRKYGKLKAADTPREYAERFRSNARLFPDIDLITALYMRQRYAQAEPSEQEIRRARRAWLRIRWRWIGDVLRV
ncbi:MAG: DUF4129 domain-containing transglutaminase family protein, partial [Chloroflexota bacterium]